jgi:AraC-like DNA-binding protein
MSPKKIPKQILNYVKEKHFIHNGDFFSLIDSYELSQRTGKSAHHLATQISRMEEQGWFKIIKSSSGGHRTIQINPEIYGIPTTILQH